MPMRGCCLGLILIALIVLAACAPADEQGAPSAPAGVSATAGDSQVSISWSAASGATSYNLYWGNSTGVTKTTGTKIAGVSSPYAHTGLSNGTAYYYVVTAVNAGGESADSAQVGATPLAPAGATGLVWDQGNWDEQNWQ